MLNVLIYNVANTNDVNIKVIILLTVINIACNVFNTNVTMVLLANQCCNVIDIL